MLPTGSSLASATAVDGSSITKTNGYAMSVTGGSTTNLTFDLNGNMTSDGTNSYSWDAENRMIKITYPGTNNFSTFVYDGLSRNVSIVETTAGSVTSTKQFVWAAKRDKMRPFQACEERDGTGALTKKFFNGGQTISGSSYFYSADQLESIREMTDSSGVVQARYTFDSFGRVSKILETVATDFGYASYYVHARSGLNLTKTRAYSASLGRFLTRDPIEEDGGVNLFEYVLNNPISMTDPAGTAGIFTIPFCKLFPNFPGCQPKPKCKNPSKGGSGTPPLPPLPPKNNDDDDEGGHNDDCHADCYADYEKCIKRCQRFINPIRRKLCYEQCATDLGDCYHDCDTR